MRLRMETLRLRKFLHKIVYIAVSNELAAIFKIHTVIIQKT